ncbi:hypothetical protein MPSEU_000494000 [Mayamaea pseudoterrestris]|nr:hypothetical protein MPSEU_000494000 [Mayamaea pseudoterrestris]
MFTCCREYKLLITTKKMLGATRIAPKLLWRGRFHGSFRSVGQLSKSLAEVLRDVHERNVNPHEAEELIMSLLPTSNENNSQNNDEVLRQYANIDHARSLRTGFPEAVFAQGKSPEQVARILDDMARHANENAPSDNQPINPILATRVSLEMYKEVSAISFSHGAIKYHETARIISMTTSSGDTSTPNSSPPPAKARRRVVVVTAGTTDIFVAEEAAVTLEAAGCVIERVYDCGVAGLHRIVQATPRLRHKDVAAVIVCAGMDGALPSVVGGLVDVPVIAVPTSIGYGASFGGVSAMLTMLNTCSPGVATVNIDNGFGAAAIVYKMIK